VGPLTGLAVRGGTAPTASLKDTLTGFWRAERPSELRRVSLKAVTVGRADVRLARPNIQIYDVHVVDLYQWARARYFRWCGGCRYKSKARFGFGTRPNFRTDHADFQPKVRSGGQPSKSKNHLIFQYNMAEREGAHKWCKHLILGPFLIRYFSSLQGHLQMPIGALMKGDGPVATDKRKAPGLVSPGASRGRRSYQAICLRSAARTANAPL
jgi:hypothetical protein